MRGSGARPRRGEVRVAVGTSRARRRIRTSTPPKEPAGLSRLRLPFRHPGLRQGCRGEVAPGVVGAGDRKEGEAELLGCLLLKGVGGEDAFDHVGDDTIERSCARAHRDDSAVREPPDGADGSGVARWAAEGWGDEPRSPRCLSESLSSHGESEGGARFHAVDDPSAV